MRWIALFFSSSAFLGFLPGKLTGKPGAGSGLVGSLIAFVIQTIFIMKNETWAAMLFEMAVVFFVGMVTIGPAESLMCERWGSRRRHNGEIVTSDYNETNIDEIVGQLVAGFPIFFIETMGYGEKLILLLPALILFRLLDVYKPWPIKKVEQWAKRNVSFNSLSIMLDDVSAGIYAASGVSFFIIIMIII
jgi:phosphatidylglycerophosphatase A